MIACPPTWGEFLAKSGGFSGIFHHHIDMDFCVCYTEFILIFWEIKMKKYIAILLCLIMILSLFSCSVNNNEDTPSQNENSNTTPPNGSEDTAVRSEYADLIGLYRNAINVCQNYTDEVNGKTDFATRFGITDRYDQETFNRLLSVAHLFYPGRGKDDSTSPHYKLSCGYAVKDINGDGTKELVFLRDDYTIVAIYSMSASSGEPYIIYTCDTTDNCWIDGNGWIHVSYNGIGYSSKHTYEIRHGRLEHLVGYGKNYEWVNGVCVESYYKFVLEGNKKEISQITYESLDKYYSKYLGVYSGVEVTKEYSGLEFTPLFDEADIAVEMYDSVLENKVKVYEVLGDFVSEPVYLKDFRTPYNRIPLCDVARLGYVYMDVDGDHIRELVIDCSDTLILRYYDGKVYVYSFTFRNMYYLKTDGSYSWNHNGQNFEYGENKLAFDGVELKRVELWRIVNDGEPDAEYYIGDKKVTEEELSRYIDDNPKTKVEFYPLLVSWQTKITENTALNIANVYWSGHVMSGDPFIIVPVQSSEVPPSVYAFQLKWLINETYSVIDEVWIDKVTGMHIIPYNQGGKG